jgi:outer membrane immunogenic protein
MKIKPYLLASALSALPFAANATPPGPMPFTWTGFYVGASGGFISQGTTATDIGGMLFPDGTTLNITGTGGIFGVNGGYNYQMGAIVLGLEADIALSTLDSTSTFLAGAGPVVATSKLRNLGTVRGRIGYAFDRVLVYGTGGFAYGNVWNKVNLQADPNLGGSTSGTRTGWTIGGGLEYAITNNWTVRAEGLYVDLGRSTSAPCTGCRFGFKNTYGLGRIGLNFKF